MTTDQERDASARFKSDIAKHVMTVLHDDGLYRHIRFAQADRSGYWFELVTWPGSLAIRGDMGGGYVFSRIADMFGFFRRNGNSLGINPGYWAEKLPDGGKSVREYSEDVLKAELDEHLAEYETAYPKAASEYALAKWAYDRLPYAERWPYGKHKEPVEPKSPDELRERIAEYEADGELGYEDGARRLLGELESAGVVSDSWEWDLTAWSYHYLWCCHAIVWGIAQYDAFAPNVETLVPAGGVL